MLYKYPCLPCNIIRETFQIPIKEGPLPQKEMPGAIPLNFFCQILVIFSKRFRNLKIQISTCSGMYSQCLNNNLFFVIMFGSFSISKAYYFVILFISPFRIRIIYFFIKLTEEISSMTSQNNITPYSLTCHSNQECVDSSLVIAILRLFIVKINMMEQVYI